MIPFCFFETIWSLILTAFVWPLRLQLSWLEGLGKDPKAQILGRSRRHENSQFTVEPSLLGRSMAPDSPFCRILSWDGPQIFLDRLPLPSPKVFLATQASYVWMLLRLRLAPLQKEANLFPKVINSLKSWVSNLPEGNYQSSFQVLSTFLSHVLFTVNVGINY